MRIDFHSHILPGIDDGAKDVKHSLEMLSMLRKDGVDVVIATPHLYLHETTIDGFVAARRKALNKLISAISESRIDCPQIILGAEVYFSTALTDLDLQKLCIEGTNYILVEMPYQHFSTTLLNSFKDFVNYCECNVVLAHIERYFAFNELNDIEKILDNDVLAQFNCDSVLERSVRKKFWKLLFDGRIHVMGTDAHNAVHRAPNFGKAEKYLRRKLGEKEFERLLKAACLVLENASMSRIVKLRHSLF